MIPDPKNGRGATMFSRAWLFSTVPAIRTPLAYCRKRREGPF
jgi:hypothetical protein